MISMAQLIVRNVEEEAVRRLKMRAVRNRRSMEAEHREILRTALLGRRPGKTLKQHLLAMPDVGAERDFARQADAPRRVKL